MWFPTPCWAACRVGLTRQPWRASGRVSSWPAPKLPSRQPASGPTRQQGVVATMHAPAPTLLPALPDQQHREGGAAEEGEQAASDHHAAGQPTADSSLRRAYYVMRRRSSPVREMVSQALRRLHPDEADQEAPRWRWVMVPKHTQPGRGRDSHAPNPYHRGLEATRVIGQELPDTGTPVLWARVEVRHALALLAGGQGSATCSSAASPTRKSSSTR